MMIKFEEAYNIVKGINLKLAAEKVPMEEALGYVLAEDVLSDMNMPPFNKSAMDGYACRETDLANELEVIEIIPAGKTPEKTIGKNQCAKIMTGAMIPKGADCVIIVEDTQEVGKNKVRYTKPVPEINVCQVEIENKPNVNICYIGEDIKTGDIVLKKGTLIKAQHIAIMASVGYTEVLVHRKPKVAVIPTGDEIVEPHIKPDVSQIRNSNGAQLVAQLKAMGIKANYYGIARDVEGATMGLIKKAYAENDVILLTGGVSMGDFDLVPEILKTLEFDLLFQAVAVQPGKPTVFGRNGNKFCFGLPGNPVSSFVQFELLAKTLLYGLMGQDYQPLNLRLPLGKEYKRKKDKRMSWIPAVFTEEGTIVPVEYHGSAHIRGLGQAQAIFAVPIGVKELKKGDLVDVRQI
ncbi:MAG: molybdopterin molybdotransferase MoeA [Bacteroidales bacterium]|nr:molybdopterin molybdotransferase MoeA [Bacteroidales bacterium]